MLSLRAVGRLVARETKEIVCLFLLAIVWLAWGLIPLIVASLVLFLINQKKVGAYLDTNHLVWIRILTEWLYIITGCVALTAEAGPGWGIGIFLVYCASHTFLSINAYNTQGRSS